MQPVACNRGHRCTLVQKPGGGQLSPEFKTGGELHLGSKTVGQPKPGSEIGSAASLVPRPWGQLKLWVQDRGNQR